MVRLTSFLSLSCILFTSIVTSLSVESDRRIVALGDLHGDLENTLEILKFSNIIDQDNHWIGGDAIFVQTVRVVYCIIHIFILLLMNTLG